MPKLFDWGARPVERLVTVGSLRAGKGRPARHAQITADTDDEILRTAFRALTGGADAVITARRLSLVSLLASEDIPVMGHLGFVPRKSTWTGRTRGVGRDAEEAEELWHRFRRLEEAGAFAVEAELVAAPLLAAITRKSGLVTVSLGSGAGGDVMFLFTQDIIGDVGPLPRHARSWGDVASLRRRIEAERLRALCAFRAEVAAGSFPVPGEVIHPDSDSGLDALLDRFG